MVTLRRSRKILVLVFFIALLYPPIGLTIPRISSVEFGTASMAHLYRITQTGSFAQALKFL